MILDFHWDSLWHRKSLQCRWYEWRSRSNSDHSPDTPSPWSCWPPSWGRRCPARRRPRHRRGWSSSPSCCPDTSWSGMTSPVWQRRQAPVAQGSDFWGKLMMNVTKVGICWFAKTLSRLGRRSWSRPGSWSWTGTASPSPPWSSPAAAAPCWSSWRAAARGSARGSPAAASRAAAGSGARSAVPPPAAPRSVCSSLLIFYMFCSELILKKLTYLLEAVPV